MSDRGDEDEEFEGLRILGSDPDLDDDAGADAELPHWSASPGDGGAWAADEPAWGGGEEPFSSGVGDEVRLDDLGAGSPDPGGTSEFNPSLLPPEEYGEPYEPAVAPVGSPYADDPGEFGAVPAVSADEPPRPAASGPAPAGAGRDLPTAIGVAGALAAVAVICFLVGPKAALVLVAVVLAAASVEWFYNLRQRGYQPATLLGIAASAAMPLAAYWRGPEAVPLVLFLTIVVGGLWYLMGVATERPVPNLGVTLYGVVYIGVLGSFAGLMLKFPNGVGMLGAAIIVTVAYDVGGFLIGSTMGRSRLSSASPNKTIEGLLGGGVAAIVVAVVWLNIVGLAPIGTSPGGFAEALSLGVAAAIIAPIGDLIESMLKRDLDVKDMGSILPGHGGLLDRFDALLLMLPTTYYIVRLYDLF